MVGGEQVHSLFFFVFFRIPLLTRGGLGVQELVRASVGFVLLLATSSPRGEPRGKIVS